MVSLATQYGLVLSNAAAFAPLMYAWRRRRLPEATLVLAALVASTMFHMCQEGWTCFGMPLQALQIADHFFVYTVVAWFGMYALSIPLRARITVAFVAQAFMLPLIVSFLHKEWVGAAIVAFSFAVTLVVFAIIVRARGMPYLTVSSLVIAVITVAAGMVLHVLGGDFGEANGANYPLYHTVWHVLAFLALLFVLDVPYPDSFVVITWTRVRRRVWLVRPGKRKKRRMTTGKKKSRHKRRLEEEEEGRLTSDETVLSIGTAALRYDF